jgi:hypothetical protein
METVMRTGVTAEGRQQTAHVICHLSSAVWTPSVVCRLDAI